MMQLGIRNMGLYLLVMVLVWYAFHESGIHATIAGVIFGLLTPSKPGSVNLVSGPLLGTSQFLQGGGGKFRRKIRMLRKMEVASRRRISPIERFETELHPWSAFVIMPLFALANAGVAIELSDFTNPLAVAVMLGLVVGKPLGIVLFSWLAVKSGLARLPEELAGAWLAALVSWPGSVLPWRFLLPALLWATTCSMLPRWGSLLGPL